MSNGFAIRNGRTRTPKSYEVCKEILLAHRGKDKDRRKIDNNTWLIREMGEDQKDIYVIRLHSTRILVFYADGSVSLNDDGYRTMTTKARMNEYLPGGWHIWSRRGTWYISTSPWGRSENARSYVYATGMLLRADGTVDGAGAEDQPAKERKLRKAAKKYAEGFFQALADGKVGKPDGGDCWFCCMRDMATGKTMHESGSDISVHFNDEGTGEPYYVPSLLVRAMEVFPVSSYARDYAWAAMGDVVTSTQGLVDKLSGGPLVSVAQRQIVASIRRFVCRCMGLSA